MSSQLELSIPGKAFLAGEYLALSGGPALIAAVEPRFVLKVRPFSEARPDRPGQNPFHENSPAGILWKKNEEFFSSYEIEFLDPHQGRGGWGGSTAEFAGLHALLQMRSDIDLHLMWEDYQKVCSDLELKLKQKPSGADLIGQVNGGLTMFHRELGKINWCAWNFENLGFLLFSTGEKLATHLHLQTLAEFSSVGLQSAMEKILLSFKNVDSDLFVEGLRSYANELQELGFVAPQTQSYLQKIKHANVVVSKGCGAMGADVLCVVYKKTNEARSEILQELAQMGLQLVAEETSLSGGLQVLQAPVPASEAVL